jgi:hypothetical protein
MGRKIFISYKYSDNNVFQLENIQLTTVRDYVDLLQEKIDKSDHINKGEDDGEDLSSLSDSTIASKLGDKIFDSSITIVFISPGMKENKSDSEQWIPWEVSYSLKEQKRENRNSKTNAVLAIVLPDKNNSYEYFMYPNPACKSITYATNKLFDILKDNMFNRKEKDTKPCNGNILHYGRFSYIHCVKWDDFIKNTNSMDAHLKLAYEICDKKDDYVIRKSV